MTSGNLRRPVISQSTQRNLRPPVFTSTNRIGLLHFGQMGGGVFLGIGSPFHQGGSSTLSVTDNSRKRETVINHPAPFNGPVTSQFRAIDTVFKHSAIFRSAQSRFRSAGSELRGWRLLTQRSTLTGIDSSAAIFDLIFTNIHHWHQSGHGGYGDAADSVRRRLASVSANHALRTFLARSGNVPCLKQ